ncbi:hypothetical protein B1199_16635 [Pseudoalteromonas ulvae]|uniref:Solute-binding protein family 3/N-terminal domain-containing protein n=2 Tax=Pseudoalteromonas ulvae TaxID=107327 RepID=A0A244CN00_PSEDV|nr:hypothetical protein B1199_16635 [Pseudoalteromonas ulvae]
MRKTVCYCMSFVLCLTSYSLVAKSTLRVVTEEWPPYNYTNDNGKVVGTATAKVRWILDQAGIDYTLESYPWARAIDLAANNKNVAIFSVYRTQVREHTFKWVCPLISPVPTFMYKLKDRTDLNVTSFEDAKRYQVSVTRGDLAQDVLTKAGFELGVNLDLAANGQVSIKKLFAKRIDFVIYSEIALLEQLKKINRSYDSIQKVMELTVMENLPICLAFHKDAEDSLVNDVQEMLDLLDVVSQPSYF